MRYAFIAAALVASLAGPPAVAAGPDEGGPDNSGPVISITVRSITIIAPRLPIGARGPAGGPYHAGEAASVVFYGDLNLRTPDGRDELAYRVDAAARQACGFADQRYAAFDPDGSPGDCRSDAVKMAEAQVRDAVERAALYEKGD